jgi:hypothetical protein
MNLTTLKIELQKFERQAVEQISLVESLNELESIRVKIL